MWEGRKQAERITAFAKKFEELADVTEGNLFSIIILIIAVISILTSFRQHREDIQVGVQERDRPVRAGRRDGGVLQRVQRGRLHHRNRVVPGCHLCGVLDFAQHHSVPSSRCFR